MHVVILQFQMFHIIIQVRSTNITSKIDPFFVSESLHNIMSECSIIDNHLYSDHVPLYLKLI